MPDVRQTSQKSFVLRTAQQAHPRKQLCGIFLWPCGCTAMGQQRDCTLDWPVLSWTVQMSHIFSNIYSHNKGYKLTQNQVTDGEAALVHQVLNSDYFSTIERKFSCNWKQETMISWIRFTGRLPKKCEPLFWLHISPLIPNHVQNGLRFVSLWEYEHYANKLLLFGSYHRIATYLEVLYFWARLSSGISGMLPLRTTMVRAHKSIQRKRY